MKALSYATSLKKLSDNPIGFITDTIIRIIVNLIVPIPLIGEIVLQFKGPVLGALGMGIILIFFMIIIGGTILLSPLLVGTSIIQTILSPFTHISSIPPDTSFTSTSIPKRNPFGGFGMSYTTVTAYFMDPNYYLQFGKNHLGIDLIPSDSYLQNSTSYQQTHQVAAFSIIDGTVNHYIDQYGGETVEVTNSDSSLKVIYIHFSSVLVSTGDIIKAGTPVGIMGASGEATGPHVHYQIDTKDGNNWDPVNPLNYIQ